MCPESGEHDNPSFDEWEAAVRVHYNWYRQSVALAVDAIEAGTDVNAVLDPGIDQLTHSQAKSVLKVAILAEANRYVAVRRGASKN
jgi:hypothetical protein